jgi:hypothetical protein
MLPFGSREFAFISLMPVRFSMAVEAPVSANLALTGIARELMGRSGTIHERIFAGLSVPCSILVSAFVHGKEMAGISHFMKIRVP